MLLCRAGFCVVFFPEIFPTELLVFSDFFFSGAPAIRNVVLFALFVINLLYPYPMCYDETAVWRAQQALKHSLMIGGACT